MLLPHSGQNIFTFSPERNKKPHILQTYSSGILTLFLLFCSAVMFFSVYHVYNTPCSIRAIIVRMRTWSFVYINALFIFFTKKCLYIQTLFPSHYMHGSKESQQRITSRYHLKYSLIITSKFLRMVFLPRTISPCPGMRYSTESLESSLMLCASILMSPPYRSVLPTPI